MIGDISHANSFDGSWISPFQPLLVRVFSRKIVFECAGTIFAGTIFAGTIFAQAPFLPRHHFCPGTIFALWSDFEGSAINLRLACPA
jgi:hypothetical protein